MEIHKTEQRSYMIIAVLLGRFAQKCHTKLQNVLNDCALLHRKAAICVYVLKSEIV
jgi:hypothetical protein